MTISSINISMGASYGAYNQKLTQETKNKLEELGIAYSSNITEAQARKLIKNFETQNNSNTKQDKNKESDLFKKAKNLAEKVGIPVEEGENFEQLLKKIESTITQRLELNKNDVAALKKLQVLSQELANIQAESTGSSGYDNTNEALMTSLELLGEYNKNFLHKH